MGKLIGSLAGDPGMTNAKISAASGLSYSEVNRYLKELVAKGVVIRESAGNDKSKYRIAPDIEGFIKNNLNPE